MSERDGVKENALERELEWRKDERDSGGKKKKKARDKQCLIFHPPPDPLCLSVQYVMRLCLLPVLS